MAYGLDRQTQIEFYARNEQNKKIISSICDYFRFKVKISYRSKKFKILWMNDGKSS